MRLTLGLKDWSLEYHQPRIARKVIKVDIEVTLKRLARGHCQSRHYIGDKEQFSLRDCLHCVSVKFEYRKARTISKEFPDCP